MSEHQSQMEMQTNANEEKVVTEILSGLTEEEKIDIVKQSFIVGAGSIRAHDMYIYYLCKLFAIQPREGGLLLRSSFSTLNQDGKRKVIQSAYQRHMDTMKKDVKTTKKTASRISDPIGNFEAAIKTTEANLPTILGNNAFSDITNEEEGLFNQLPKDFTPSLDSPVVKTLRKISADRGYYDDREWYQQLQSK